MGRLRGNQAKTEERQRAHEEVGERAGGINPIRANAAAKDGGAQEDDVAVQQKARASVAKGFVIEGDQAHGHDGNCRDGEPVVFIFGRTHVDFVWHGASDLRCRFEKRYANDIVYGFYSVEA